MKCVTEKEVSVGIEHMYYSWITQWHTS
jgi:hypothetical protein